MNNGAFERLLYKNNTFKTPRYHRKIVRMETNLKVYSSHSSEGWKRSKFMRSNKIKWYT